MKTYRSMVLISHDPASIQLGADAVQAAFLRELARFDLQDEVSVSLIEDIGKSFASPLVIVYPEAVIYGRVTVEDVPHLVEEHLYKGRIVEEKVAPSHELSGRVAWVSARKGTLPAETRIVLKNVGVIDPNSVEDYIANDGYLGLGNALGMTPEQVIALITASGLQGRGGAGFPAGLKWGFVRQARADQKYVICNADESEPGTFKDRVLIEGDPHQIIEAMLIAAYAVGATEGYVYLRGEYQLAIQRMETAIAHARSVGLLGDNILGSALSFNLHLHTGAGAYICGEETALIESIEGKRGEPRSRPPYPTTEGLWGKPTLVNNVETLANIPPILRHGADWYRTYGTPSSPGTKVCTLLGNLNVTGLIEVPMGITLREMISIYGKGIKDGHFKMAQTGGSGGSIIPASLQDTPMDFASFARAGVVLGSGALLICNDSVCVVDLARVLLNFFRKESCGKCSPCRICTQKAYEILTDISKGRGSMGDLDALREISIQLNELSNCGLGQTAAVPLRDTLTHFRDEVEAHIRLKVCPAGVCSMS
ncbi:MAG TPA: NADH-ubiquinone oxidoreductase-F iron-sulfur binding region domain-containing protein [Anaerolineaceae bacterium]|jgi:NADP-reducing hydrogenase subunit HndC|nr:NADP oxidoreductase [Anaerolineales bacterium]HOG57938.1 NADH-ubiquinone oxidoreductase-F iron-sulfur binding region domain-containing protein [Anaerolineaceae bacterium]HOR83783.1 NADH-ubiquinone oxidoreductase-F iron-sulfur binding region domain-containing protein [Anaerolineaceae bacterium]HPL42693.1 NADH-ubiquinone oxidoreductase-F iron-sulfur binding region domain-containing protein [Anaerolineaceae bacterium]HPY32801.1 NADH-ubiquinone oxidoreductase-F iron-sulfur binding region domain-